MKDAKTLTYLPPELFELIVGHATKDDLLSIRLVSKDCHEKTMGPFAQSFFSEVRVAMRSESSLRNAIKRVEHPFFGGFTRSVSVVIDEYKVRCDRCEVVHDAQEWVRSQRLDFDSLTGLFRRLRILDRAQDIKLVTTTEAPRWIVQPKDARYPSECLTAPAMRDHYSFITVIQALAASGLDATSFCMDTPSWSLPVHKMAKGYCTVMQNAIRNVRTLTLDVWIDSRMPTCIQDFFNTLANLEHLKTLTLQGRHQVDIHFDVADFPDPNGISKTLFQTNFHHLQSLKLNNTNIKPADFADFTQRHQQLQSISLRDPWFVGTRAFDVRYYCASEIRTALQALTGKDDVEVAFHGALDSWKWATRVSGREPFRRW